MNEHESTPADESPKGEAEGGGEEHIPLEPEPESRDEPKARIDKPSLMSESGGEDVCPNCGATMPNKDAVVCIECGFDQVANKKIKTKFGVGKLSSMKSDDDDGVFSEATKIGWQVFAAAGLIALGAAAAMAGVNAGDGKVRAVLKVLIYGPIIASIGVGAVAVTARLVEDRVGRIDFAAARMLLAVGGFTVMFELGKMVDAHVLVQFLLGALLGVGVYYLVVWLSFSLDTGVAALLGGMHFILWLAFILLMEAIGWLEASGGSAAAASG